MGRSGNPAKRWESTGIKVNIDVKYQAEPQDPGEGKHLWNIITVFEVDPTNRESMFLDKESLITIQGPGCFKCERPYRAGMETSICHGSMS